jgi:hypothetical protein
MPFSEPFETYYKKIIKPAVDDNDLYSIRGDSMFRSTHIMDDIWQSINESEIVIAELTGKNPNVFYELGLAHALGKPAILISSDLSDVPFDLRPLRVFIYDKNDPEWGMKLRDNISKAINETIASPIQSIPHTFRNYKKPENKEEINISTRLSMLESKVESITIKEQDLFSNLGEAVHTENKNNRYAIKDRVRHLKFGLGTVIAFEGTNLQERIQINFDEVGLKWLMVALANLDRV